jgi:serine phosphatase RsbU (regulator of sigma subunit)
VGSLLVLPLTAGGQHHGALFAARAVTDGFEEDDAGALATFAGQAALALSHATLFEDALEKARLARELALAREVQQRLLPQSLPAIRGTEIAAAERPAHEVCGDYYDVVDLGGGCVGLLVADVAGKGAAAAFYMAELKGIVQGAAKLTRSPGAFLARANEALAGSLGRTAFISAVYGVLDPAAGTFTFARAGHCPVVMARAPEHGGGHWLLRADGLGLGLDPGPLFRRTLHEQVVRLAPGDVFALYSDGLVEARSAAGEEYGYDRLADALCRHRALGAQALLDALLDDQRAFAGDAPYDDDLTLVVLRWNGTAPANGAAAATSDAPPASAARPEPFFVRPAFEGAEVGAGPAG